MTASSVVLFTFLFSLAYLIAPIMLIWGWVRWIKQRPPVWKASSTLSFLGFGLATASGLFALGIILFAEGGGFGTTGWHYAPNYTLFSKCVRLGAFLSVASIALAIGGVWRPN
jgi:hypothetical protein